jgi:autotransporter adhesin
MNKVYKSVWNESLGEWVAASELSAARGKSSGKITRALLASAVAFGSTGVAVAGATDGGSVESATGVAVGPNAKSQDTGTVAIGMNAYTDGTIGSFSPAGTISGTIAVGYNARAMGTGSIALGQDSAVSVNNTPGGEVNDAIAFGHSATTTGQSSISLGTSSTASATSAVALGSASTADRDNTVSIGNATTQRQLVQVASGTQATDAVNLGQLTPVVAALGRGAAVNADGSFTAPSYKIGATTYNNVGDALDAVAAAGAQTKYLAANDAATNSNGAKAVGIGSLAIGGNAVADSTGGLDAALAIGSDSLASAKATALGPGATASALDSVALGTRSVADRANTVSVGNATVKRQIVNVAAGTQATDAVNVTQLQSVTTLLGAGAKVNADGTMTAPAYTVAGTTYGTVGDAVAQIDTQLDNKLAYDTADKTSVTLGGVGTTAPVRLANVAAGTLSSTSSDAVNGSQLYATNQNVAALQSFTAYVNNGGGITYFHSNSTLADSSATGTNAVAIGGAAFASGANAVALGANSVADRANSVSMGAVGSERQVTNVAAGTASTDAANVGQLNAVSNSVTQLGASAIKYDTNTDGTPDYANATLGNGNAGTTLHNVAAGTSSMDAVNLGQMNDALGVVTNLANGAYNPLFSADGNRDTQVATASGTLSVASGANAVASGAKSVASGANAVSSGVNAVAIGSSATASASNSVALGANAVADRANSVSVGTTSAGGQRQIVNVEAGTQGTDAVNVNQMQQSVNTGVKSANGYTDALRSDMNSGLSLANNHINSVGAMSSAMAMMAGSAAAVADKDNRFAAGTGVYRNKAAIAVGFQKRFGTNMVLTLGGSTTGEETTGGAGFAFGF